MEFVKGKIILNIDIFYGSLGYLKIDLPIADENTPISKLARLSGWIEDLLADAFEEVGFDVSIYDKSTVAFPSLLEIAQNMSPGETVNVPAMLEFQRKGQPMRAINKVKILALKKGLNWSN